MKNIFISAGVSVLIVVLGLVFLPRVDYNYGAVPGNNYYNQVDFAGGVVHSRLVATTSQGASITVSANEFKDWANSSVVSFRQGLTAETTLTFPASSSVPFLVPKAGDKQTFCIRNATTTANLKVILAGSTGINLNVASSSVSALGSDLLYTGEVGCITLIRQPLTATSFDIDALLTVFR